MKAEAFGTPRATLKRSWRGLLIGLGFCVLVFGGRRPRIVTFAGRPDLKLSVSEAEYTSVDALIEAALRHVGDRVEDERG